jgi:hypothetical protein
MARAATRSLGFADFDDAANLLEAEAKRESDRVDTLPFFPNRARADALRRIAALIRSIGDE